MSDLNSPEIKTVSQEAATPNAENEFQKLRIQAAEYEAFLKTLTGFNQKVDHALDKEEKLRLALLFFELKPMMSTNSYSYIYSDLAAENPRFGSAHEGLFIFNRQAVTKIIQSNPELFADFQGGSLETYLSKIKLWSMFNATAAETTKAGLLYGFPKEAVTDFVEKKDNLLHFNKYGIQFNYSPKNAEIIAQYDNKIRKSFRVLNDVKGFQSV